MNNIDKLHEELDKQTAKEEEVKVAIAEKVTELEERLTEIEDKNVTVAIDLTVSAKKIEGEQKVQDDRLTELEP